MAVTLGQMRNRILYYANRDNPDYVYGANEAILTAIRYMESYYPFVFNKSANLTIQANTNTVSLPEDLNRLLDVRYLNGNMLYGVEQGFEGLSYAAFNARCNSTTQTGYPRKYSIYNNAIYVYPQNTSDVELVISYDYKDAFLPQNDNDSSIWFGDFTIDCTQTKALANFYRFTLQSNEIANNYELAFQDFAKIMISKHNNQQVFNLLDI